MSCGARIVRVEMSPSLKGRLLGTTGSRASQMTTAKPKIESGMLTERPLDNISQLIIARTARRLRDVCVEAAAWYFSPHLTQTREQLLMADNNVSIEIAEAKSSNVARR